MEMIFTRYEEIVDANPESTPITQNEINIRELQNPSRKF